MSSARRSGPRCCWTRPLPPAEEAHRMATDSFVDESAVLRAFDDSPGLQIVVRAGDRRVVAANRGAREMLQRDELVGMQLQDLREPGIQTVMTALSEVLRTGVPFD